MANPSLSKFADSGDGYVRNHGNFAWSAIRDGSSGTKSADSTSAVINFVYNDGTTADKYIDRGFFSFDLSSIPTGASVISAVLKLYVDGKYTGAGGSVGMVAGTQASTTTLATSDFGNVGSTEYMTRINFTSFTAAAYNDLTLNSTGLAAVQTAVGGTFKIALRGSFDLDNSAPGTTVYSGVYGKATEETGTAKDPYLLVTYTRARTTADAWAWSDEADAGTDVGTAHTRSAGESWLWTDTARKYTRSSTAVTVRAEGLNTYLSATQASNTGTITVPSTSGFPSQGQIGIVDYASATYYQETLEYTGTTATTFTGVTGGSSHSFPGTTSLVSALDAESHFPQITPLDTTTTPPLLCTYHQGFWHGDTTATIKGKISLDGGATWGTEQTYMTCVQAGRGMGMHTLLRLSDGTYYMSWSEWGHDYSTARALSVYTARGTWNGATLTFDTPVAVPTAFSKDDMAIGLGVVEYGGSVYQAVYGLDSGGRWDDSPQSQYCKLIKTTDKGATTGNWSTVSTLASLANCSSRASGEPSLMILNDGTWLAQFRCEVYTGFPNLDRYQATSTDNGVTWSGHTRAIQQLGNIPVVHLMPEGHIVSQGQDLAHSGQTITYFSTDQGVTWPSTYYRQEATDATYSVGNGSDFATVLRASDQGSTTRQVVNAYSQERASQGGAQVKFQWYAVPNFPIAADSWAWSDVAAVTNRAYGKTTGDSWAWSDAASFTRAFFRTGYNFLGSFDYDFWAWSDSAAGDVSQGKNASDAWAWSDSATRSSQSFARPVSSTWTWSESASGSVGPQFELWAWSDVATVSTSISGAAGQSGFSITSALGAELVVDGVVDASLTFTAVV